MYKLKRIKPTFNHIVVTMNCYDRNYKTGSIIDSSKAGLIKEYQTVVEIGPMVKGINVGDVVFINPQRYLEIKHHFKDADANNVQKDDMHAILRIPRFTLYDGEDGASREVMLLGDNDVFFVAEGEEFNENPTIITPDKPKIILP
jgi:hypothetical protein